MWIRPKKPRIRPLQRPSCHRPVENRAYQAPASWALAGRKIACETVEPKLGFGVFLRVIAIEGLGEARMIWTAITFVLAVFALLAGQIDPMTLVSGLGEILVVLALFTAVCAAEAFN
jgi:hypothetical protein